ncbi:ankyrin repeat-containing protein NPR4-like isoform X1 [Neltuma alba]|uniref:ankyrin repeat-containing protein NPR4-like isoform X1 n=1 Tax=Neltuma alba TaxID=207710 RepID=UPI0010A4AB58|nr:ankyrin repeat-containing protein NPR4-like isoform X1 [Prosopis alba]
MRDLRVHSPVLLLVVLLLCLLLEDFMRYPSLATMADSNGSVIFNVLSKMPSDFQSGSKLGILGRFIYHFVPEELDHLQPRGDLKDLHDAPSKGFVWKTIEKLGMFFIVVEVHFQRSSRSILSLTFYVTKFAPAVPSIKLVRDTKLRHKSAERLVEHVCSQAFIMNNFIFWQSFVSADILYNTISSGIVEILRICFKFFPDLIWTKMPNEGYIMQVAIKNRQEKVFSLLCKMPIGRLLVLVVDESQNTTSHLAARLTSSPQLASVSGAAFQMQKELQWFKEVEKLDHPLHKQVKNQEGKTAWQLFKDEHKGLHEQGEKWMKDTSNSSMLVAALIATVAFAAAVTVPGGNDQTKGIPIFLRDKAFMVFAVSNALALFSSVASIFMFLSILTAYYAEEDFLKTLPRKIILSLASLFVSIATILIAFGAALSLALRERLKWVPIPITLLASLPLALFAMLQVPLFVRMIVSTYGRAICQPRDLW